MVVVCASAWSSGFLECFYRAAQRLRQGGRMGMNSPLGATEARFVEPQMVVPVPAPPKSRFVRPRAAPQNPPSRGREHEVRRLIRDLAALAAKHHASARGAGSPSQTA